MSLLGIILTFSLVDNIVLSRLLGICPCVGAPGGMRATVSTSAATALLMSLSALAAWALESFILGPLGLEFLRTPAFVLSVAGIAGLLDIGARRAVPQLLRAAGRPPCRDCLQLRHPRSCSDCRKRRLQCAAEPCRGRCGRRRLLHCPQPFDRNP